MTNYQTSPSAATDLIVKELRCLLHKFERVDNRDSPILPPIDEINTQISLLLEKQACLLPLLRQQLADLSGAVGQANPPVALILKLICHLGDTLDQIIDPLELIARIGLSLFKTPLDNDHDYGALKMFRTRHLLVEFVNLMFVHTRKVIHCHMTLFEPGGSSENPLISPDDEPNSHRLREDSIEATVEALNYIDDLIRCCKQSDVSIIRGQLQSRADDLGSILATLTQRIIVANQLEQENNLIDENLPAPNSLGETEGRQAIIGSTTNDLLQTGSYNERTEGAQSDANTSDDDDQSGTGYSTDSSVHISRRPHLVEVAQWTILVVKIIRVFWNRLSKPSSDRPFAISTKLSSAEIVPFTTGINSLVRTIQKIVDTLVLIYDNDELSDSVAHIHGLSSHIATRFDSYIFWLKCNLVSLSSSPQSCGPTLPQDPFKKCFFKLRYCFSIYFAGYTEALRGLGTE
ncbi:hypothetical protein MJO29_001347 [Puccinia striiformis f. sp. tritici]|uniref:Uncharacterized protein n=1 Tax=Puccinia striiformis f. sp. tritici PST-78 TaxID=1165861 RepID=A0A0L0UT45_9BASI|nr:hypothetical protein Pst134EA_003404 [Puccinia striiformis f. sp. tritici]KAH9472802.1 hypothetical protein Pst134EA_003404 [Puccinia striiformis f. sp. tritici]KAI7965599.1 hypothetical protein MJO29_001347 [Puccinia striiformis f. sp. tritici]KNE90218.1 hypothetical protein PSTG_16325 [Puccinia striiformis f. sp. tritici PST-78]